MLAKRMEGGSFREVFPGLTVLVTTEAAREQKRTARLPSHDVGGGGDGEGLRFFTPAPASPGLGQTARLAERRGQSSAPAGARPHTDSPLWGCSTCLAPRSSQPGPAQARLHPDTLWPCSLALLSLEDEVSLSEFRSLHNDARPGGPRCPAPQPDFLPQSLGASHALCPHLVSKVFSPNLPIS